MRKLTFFKKEMMEICRTYKIIVLPAIFLFFGLLSPLTAKFLPQLIEKFGNSQQGYIIQMSEAPKYNVAYEQLFSCIGQIGMIVIILVFMGTVVGEKVKGSAILVLTKTVTRSQFILSKYLAATILFTISFIVSVVACSYYTYLLFGRFYNNNLILGLFLMWLFITFIISMTIFASTLSKTITVSAVLGFLCFAGISALSALPVIKEYSPGSLLGMGLGLIDGKESVSEIVAPIVTSIVMIILFLIGSIYVLKKQEI